VVTILFELAASLVGALVGALRRAFRRPPTDLVLRRRILGHFAAAGSRPSPDDVEASPADFARLAERHALVLDSAGRIVIANPFSGVETDFEVQSEGSTCSRTARGTGSASSRRSVATDGCEPPAPTATSA
jgi:hypothetical protein